MRLTVLLLLIFSVGASVIAIPGYAFAAEPDAVSMTRVPGGLCVVLPAKDGAALAAYSCEGRFVVRGLTPVDALDAVRAAIPFDMGGLVSAEGYAPASTLPFADNLVDLLVVDSDALPGGPADEELLRAVSPASGAVWRKKGGQWSKLVKPMPREYGSWTHYYGDATCNPVSADSAANIPKGLQWIAESPTRQSSRNQLVEGGYYLGDFHNYTSMRRAFNGVQLWRTQSTDPWTDAKRFGSIALADSLVYSFRDLKKGPVVARDSATGKEVKVFEAPLTELKVPKQRELHWGNLAVFEDHLLLSRGDKLYDWDRGTGKLRWTFDGAGKNVAFPAVDPVNKRVGVLLAPDSITFMWADRQTSFNAAEVASIDLKDGTPAWRIAYPMPSAPGPLAQFLWAGEAFYFHHSKGLGQGGIAIGCIEAATGKPRWLKPNVKKWAGGQNDPGVGVGSLLVYPQAAILTRSAMLAYDPRNGTSLGEWTLGNSRCDNGRGDANGFTNFGHFFQFDGTKLKVVRNEVARNPCGGAALHAYGMHYFQPQVCECFEAVRGLMAVASQAVPPPLADAERLERGQAFDLAPTLKEGEGDWPALLHDSSRSASGPALKNTVPKEIWRVRLETGSQPGPAAGDWRACANNNGPISAPVIAGNLVLVSAPDTHRLYAVNATTGAKAWTFTAGARIDTPPTVAGGRVYAGCRDGYIYCLDLATGKLDWRFLAARNHRYIVAYDQLESAWPIHGSLVVENGLVLATAGYHPDIDGGIHCWGLDAATGAIYWKRVIASQRTSIDLDPARNNTNSRTYFSANRVLNSIPNSDGEYALLPGLTFKLGDGSGTPILGETPLPKKGTLPEVTTGLMVSRWGLVAPWLRSKDGEYGGPGPVIGRQYVGIPGGDGRRLAWDSKRLLRIGLCDTSLLVLDRSVPYGSKIGDHKLAKVGENVPNFGKALAVVKQTGLIHDYSPYGQDGFDPVAMLLAGNQAVLAWVELGSKVDVHARPQSVIQFMDIVNGKTQSETIVKAGVIEHGMATAQGRLFLSLEDGSLAAFE